MHRNKSAQAHQFAMIPKANIPRSIFSIEHTHKTTFDAGYLIPIYVDEILPGDKFSLKMTAFARLSTPLFPIMDNMYLDSFFFFVPNRLVWDNWPKFMGEQINPGDSISYTIPTVTCAAGGFPVGSVYDYMGLPTVGQVTGTVPVNSLPLRAYNLIWNEWFRDENLQNSVTANTGNGPDAIADYNLLKRGKRPDYFTACLPWPQKGTAVPLPLTGNAAVKTLNSSISNSGVSNTGIGTNVYATTGGVTNGVLYADLSTVTATTINALRQSIAIQQLLEQDARGGTRYVEIIYNQFGVRSPDARLQRPEYLGGGSTPVNINPIAQTGPTGTTGSSTAMGTLAAMGTALAQGHGFTQSFTEHGYVIGLISVRADLTYQQGLRKMWSRSTRYDFYTPIFANLGEQTVLQREIYCLGTGADDNVFGYQERWAEYRYHPSMITNLFRSTSAGTIDPWHLAQNFSTPPTLNSTFIEESPPVSRILAVGTGANGKQFICDTLFRTNAARPMPMYSVPGLQKL